MKPKKISKKLLLNKRTVATLRSAEMIRIQGGFEGDPIPLTESCRGFCKIESVIFTCQASCEGSC